jgi:hypothetical protein
MNFGKEIEDSTQFVETKGFVDLALYNSNVVHWIFDDAHEP